MVRFTSTSTSDSFSTTSIKSLPLLALLIILITSNVASSQPTSLRLINITKDLTSVSSQNNNNNNNQNNDNNNNDISPLFFNNLLPESYKEVEGDEFVGNGYFHELRHEVDDGITWIGSKVVRVLGFENESSNFDTLPPVSGGGIIGWSDSSLYVDRTNSLHPSRPSSFGPRVEDPLSSLLFPITTFSTSDSYGCNSSTLISSPDLPIPPKTGWIALSQRGHCPFSQKVRFAESLGAVAVIFGDQSAEEGGLGSGLSSLLTPWSPDDTRDIYIPSAFVSRATYLSLLKTYETEQTLIEEGAENEPINQDGKPRGLAVTVSADDLFTWPLLDFLLLLLFLPSMLTGLTIVTQRIRQMRERKLARAPIDAVAQLPVYLYGNIEKFSGGDDEESSVGLEEGNDESSPLLNKNSRKGYSSRSKIFFSYLPPLLRPIQASIQLAPRRRLSPQFESCLECAICLSDFEKGDKVLVLPCGHIFHQEEIVPWLTESKRLCPTCRASITIDTEEEAAAALAVPISPPVVASSATSTLAPTLIPTESSEATSPIPVASTNTRISVLQNLNRVASPVASSSSVTIESALSRRSNE